MTDGGGGDAEDWAPEVEEIVRRRGFADGMGGPEKVARQHASGRLTVRGATAKLTDHRAALARLDAALRQVPADA